MYLPNNTLKLEINLNSSTILNKLHRKIREFYKNKSHPSTCIDSIYFIQNKRYFIARKIQKSISHPQPPNQWGEGTKCFGRSGLGIRTASRLHQTCPGLIFPHVKCWDCRNDLYLQPFHRHMHLESTVTRSPKPSKSSPNIHWDSKKITNLGTIWIYEN